MSEYISEYEKERKKKEQKNTREKWDINKENKEALDQSKLSLKELKNMITEWSINLDQKTFEEIQKDNKVDNREFNSIIESLEIKELLKKIEEIVNNPDIEHILPKELRITSKEFKDACINKDKKTALLTKINTALDCVNDHVRNDWGKVGWNPLIRNITMRENLMFLTNQKIIHIQENMIDMKNYLQDN